MAADWVDSTASRGRAVDVGQESVEADSWGRPLLMSTKKPAVLGRRAGASGGVVLLWARSVSDQVNGHPR